MSGAGRVWAAKPVPAKDTGSLGALPKNLYKIARRYNEKDQYAAYGPVSVRVLRHGIFKRVQENASPGSGEDCVLHNRINNGLWLLRVYFQRKKSQLLTIVNSSKRADTIIFSPEEKLLSDNEAVELSQDGQYTLRVLFPRALARRDIKESYTLKIELENPVPDVAPRR